MPTADLLTHSRQGLATRTRQEARKPLPVSRHCSTRPEREAEEGKLHMRIHSGSAAVLAIDDPGLLRMKLKAARCKTFDQEVLDKERLPFR